MKLAIATVGLLLLAALPAMSSVGLAAMEFRVEGAGLEAVPLTYAGRCPGLIKFKGKIQASGAGRVKYTYFYNDGATGPEGYVDFDGPGVKYVETSWRLGGAARLPALPSAPGFSRLRRPGLLQSHP